MARDQREMDGKSIMGILLLAGGARIDDHDLRRRRTTNGDAVDALVALVESGFGEDACSA